MNPDEKMVSMGQKKSTYFALIAIVILALVLVGTVAAIIVLSLNTITGCEKTPANGEQINADVKVNYEGNQVKEKVNYDSGRHVAVFYNPDGSFSIDDYEKGIKVVKLVKNSDCFVIPVGTSKSQGFEVEKFLKDYKGDTINASGNSIDVQVMNGTIQDTSFLPQEAQDQCDSFKWLAVVIGENSEQKRMKRDWECEYICFYEWITVNGVTKIYYDCYILLDTCVKI